MSNIYKDRYQKFIKYYIENPTEGFVEKHHIIPKCLGGNNLPSNIVLLPVRTHFIAHYMLHKAYPKNRNLAHAFAMMGVCNKHQHRKSKLYEKSKIARSNALIGNPRPEWVKEKLRKPKKNTQNYKKEKSKEHCKNISRALKGKKKSDQHIKKLVESQKLFMKKRSDDMEMKKSKFRQMFIDSGLTRKQFYKEHQELSESTIKRYLIGL